MARRVFFSYHHERDAFRVWQVRNTNKFLGYEDAGFIDEGEWQDLRQQGNTRIMRALRERIGRASVTVILIGTHTVARRWVRWEIEESLRRGNGLLGVRIHHLQDENQETSPVGPLPVLPRNVEFPVLTWDSTARCRARFRDEIESAGKRSDKQRSAKRIAAVVKRPIPPPALPLPPLADPLRLTPPPRVVNPFSLGSPPKPSSSLDMLARQAREPQRLSGFEEALREEETRRRLVESLQRLAWDDPQKPADSVADPLDLIRRWKVKP